MKQVLVVGLGNPGRKYITTRHNIGFLVVTELANLSGEKFKKAKEQQAEIAVVNQGQQKIMLAKPQTFMNLSGQTVRKLRDYYKIAAADIWIVSDDVDLPFGKIRIRHSGSAGGHNGLQSIIDQLQTDAFHRLRIGLGSNRDLKIPAEDYVLQPFSLNEKQSLPAIIEQALTTLTSEISLK
ncbi:aminoacyl-tRNA hydrolase [Patescibacteria group bacterium]